MHHAETRYTRLSFATVVTGPQCHFDRTILGTTIGRLFRSDQISVAHERTAPLNAIPAPALTESFEAMGLQHLVCSLQLTGPAQVAILGDMVEIHATAVVAEVLQCLSSFRTASHLSQQMSEGFYRSADTLVSWRRVWCLASYHFALFAYRIAVQRTHGAGEPMIRAKYSTPVRNAN